MILAAMAVGFVVGTAIACAAFAVLLATQQKKLDTAEKRSDNWKELHDAVRARLEAKDEVIAAKNAAIVQLTTQVRRMSER
jgi:hypothetical protein